MLNTDVSPWGDVIGAGEHISYVQGDMTKAEHAHWNTIQQKERNKQIQKQVKQEANNKLQAANNKHKKKH